MFFLLDQPLAWRGPVAEPDLGSALRCQPPCLVLLRLESQLDERLVSHVILFFRSSGDFVEVIGASSRFFLRLTSTNDHFSQIIDGDAPAGKKGRFKASLVQ